MNEKLYRFFKFGTGGGYYWWSHYPPDPPVTTCQTRSQCIDFQTYNHGKIWKNGFENFRNNGGYYYNSGEMLQGGSWGSPPSSDIWIFDEQHAIWTGRTTSYNSGEQLGAYLARITVTQSTHPNTQIFVGKTRDTISNLELIDPIYCFKPTSIDIGSTTLPLHKKVPGYINEFGSSDGNYPMQLRQAEVKFEDNRMLMTKETLNNSHLDRYLPDTVSINKTNHYYEIRFTCLTQLSHINLDSVHNYYHMYYTTDQHSRPALDEEKAKEFITYLNTVKSVDIKFEKSANYRDKGLYAYMTGTNKGKAYYGIGDIIMAQLVIPSGDNQAYRPEIQYKTELDEWIKETWRPDELDNKPSSWKGNWIKSTSYDGTEIFNSNCCIYINMVFY